MFGARHAQDRSCGRVRHHAHAVDPLVDGLVRHGRHRVCPRIAAATATHWYKLIDGPPLRWARRPLSCHRRLGRNLSRVPERTSVVSAQWALPTPPDRSKTAQRIGQLRKCDLDQRRPGRRALHHHKSCVSGHSSIPLCRRIGRLSAAVSDVVAVHTGSVGDGILTNDPCSSGRRAWAPRSASRAVHRCASCAGRRVDQRADRSQHPR